MNAAKWIDTQELTLCGTACVLQDRITRRSKVSG